MSQTIASPYEIVNLDPAQHAQAVLRLERAVPGSLWDGTRCRTVLAAPSYHAWVIGRSLPSPMVMGWLLFRSEHQGKAAYVVRVVTDPAFRRQGLAQLMLTRLRDAFACEPPECGGLREWLVAEVSEWDLPAQLLLRSCGYRAIETLRDGKSDVYRFWRRLRKAGG